MSDILVSFIIPFYNSEKYIDNICTTLVKICGFNIEFIFVNDGSDDNSLVLLENYKEDSRVNVISLEKQGVSVARNEGIKLARGKYIMFIDVDDDINRERLQEAMFFLQSNKDLYLFPIAERRGDKLERMKMVSKFSDETTCEELLYFRTFNEDLNFCYSQFIKTSVIKENNIVFPNGVRVAEDKIFNMRLSKVIKDFEYVELVFYTYNQNSTSVMNTQYLVQFDGNIAVYDEMLGNWSRREAIDYSYNRFIFDIDRLIYLVDVHELAKKISSIKDYVKVWAKETSTAGEWRILLSRGWTSVFVYLFFLYRKKLVKKLMRKLTPKQLIELVNQRKFEKKFRQSIDRIDSIHLANNRKIRIAIILVIPETWNSVKTIYDLAIAREIDICVFCIPRRISKDIGMTIDNVCLVNEAFEFCIQNGIKAVNTYDTKSYRINTNIREYQPDYAIYIRPYNYELFDEYMSNSVCMYSKVCYVPYGYTHMLDDDVNIAYSYDFMSTVYATFFSSESMRSYCEKEYNKLCFSQYHRFEYLGYPRFDLITKRSKNVKKRRYTVLWLPRWTKESSFLKYFDSFIAMVKSEKDMEFIIRFHPLMFTNMKLENIWDEEKIDEILAMVNGLENLKIDNQTDYMESLLDADLILADYTSLLIEGYITGKPIIYCDKDKKFLPEVRMMMNTLYKESEWDNIKNLIINIKNGNDSKLLERETVINQLRIKENTNSGGAILDYIISDYRNN